MPSHRFQARKSRAVAASSAQNLNIKHFTRVGLRPQFGEYLRQTWQRRHFIIMESKARAFGTAKDTILGKIWLILDPFLSASVYFVIFSLLLNFGRGMDNFVAYLIIGIISFNLLSKSLSSQSAIEGNGKRLVKGFAFPKLSMIVSFTLRTYVDFIPTFFAMLLFIIVVPPHVFPTLSWITVPLIYLAVAPFCFGLSAIVATFVVLIPDLRLIINFLSRFWFYGSGIFWSVDMLASKPILQELMQLNPGWAFLDMLRDALMLNQFPTWGQWVYLLSWSIGTAILGVTVIWANDIRIGKALIR